MMTNNNSMAVQAPAGAASLSVYSNIIFDCKGLDLYYGMKLMTAIIPKPSYI